jgi:hypothetical protein
VKSFQEHFCVEHNCSAEEFLGKVFWLCLNRHAVPFVPFLGGFRSGYFEADRELISSAGRSVNFDQVRGEIRDFFMDPNNRGWLRKRFNMRLSTTRLKRLARRYLPDAESRSPIGGAVPE